MESRVYPTEEASKVEVAIKNLFPTLQLTLLKSNDEQLLIGEAEGEKHLELLRFKLRQERILDAARKILLDGLRGNEIKVHFNKQAAYANHISFTYPQRESPLGPITLTIICDNPERLINWLAPRTIKGVPVEDTT